MAKIFVSQEDFNLWVARKTRDYLAEAKHKQVQFTIVGDYTYVCDKNGNVGKAKCSPNDFKNVSIGIAYAYARLNGQDEYYVRQEYKPNTGEICYYCLTNSTMRFKVRYITEDDYSYCVYNFAMSKLELVTKDDVGYFKKI